MSGNQGRNMIVLNQPATLWNRKVRSFSQPKFSGWRKVQKAKSHLPIFLTVFFFMPLPSFSLLFCFVFLPFTQFSCFFIHAAFYCIFFLPYCLFLCLLFILFHCFPNSVLPFSCPPFRKVPTCDCSYFCFAVTTVKKHTITKENKSQLAHLNFTPE